MKISRKDGLLAAFKCTKRATQRDLIFVLKKKSESLTKAFQRIVFGIFGHFSPNKTPIDIFFFPERYRTIPGLFFSPHAFICHLQTTAAQSLFKYVWKTAELSRTFQTGTRTKNPKQPTWTCRENDKSNKCLCFPLNTRAADYLRGMHWPTGNVFTPHQPHKGGQGIWEG